MDADAGQPIRPGRRDEIRAEGLVSAPRPATFAYLAKSHNHWTLGGRRIQLLEVRRGPGGALQGMVQIRGPLGISRIARTRVNAAREPAFLSGTAEFGGRTAAAIRWDLGDAGTGATRVALSARIVSAGPLDRVLLALGGRWWMRLAFAATLRRLQDRLAEQAAGSALQAV